MRPRSQSFSQRALSRFRSSSMSLKRMSLSIPRLGSRAVRALDKYGVYQIHCHIWLYFRLKTKIARLSQVQTALTLAVYHVSKMAKWKSQPHWYVTGRLKSEVDHRACLVSKISSLLHCFAVFGTCRTIWSASEARSWTVTRLTIGERCVVCNTVAAWSWS